MSALPIIIVILVVAMIVGPIMMMQPSAREKRVSHWRQTAIEEGFSVRMRKVEQSNHAEYIYPWANKAKRASWTLTKQNYVHDIHFLDYWEWDGTGRPSTAMLESLAEYIKTLPAGASLIEANAAGMACCWDEQGSDADFRTILDGLKSIAARF